MPRFPQIPPIDEPILLAGAGGFIGGWLASDLRRQGFSDVRCVDVKPLEEWYQIVPDFHNSVLDLQLLEACREAVDGRVHVFNLAADMGGMGFIEKNKAACMLSSLINTHLLVASKDSDVANFFFSSSACVYNADKQKAAEVVPLRESDAYPAMPEDGYGWEKLFGERMVRHFAEDFGIQGRVARYHNVYGPHGTWEGGREKAPAAICRKVAFAVLSGTNEIEIWGDGEQTRSFTYIDDTIHGTQLLMWSNVSEPLNIGSDELVTINDLVTLVEDIAGVALQRKYILDAPKGVRGRNSDNALISAKLGWTPSISLQEGLEATYRWIFDQVARQISQT